MSEKIGKYEILERIGGSGATSVWRARDPRLNRPVAIRILTPEGGISEELKTRFYQEAQTFAGLAHPGIVTTYDVDEQGDRLFIVTELLDGKELWQLLAGSEEVAVETKLAAMLPLCDVAQYLHEKNVDAASIEPGGIVVLGSGGAKIVDLAISALVLAPASLPRRYPSPEHAGAKTDARSAQFSLASLFYEMVALAPPFQADDPAALAETAKKAPLVPLADRKPEVAADLAKAIEKALSRDPSSRYADLAAFRSDLEAVLRRISTENGPLREQLAALVRETDALDADVARRLGEEAPAATTGELPVHHDAIVRLTKSTGGRLELLRGKAAKLDAVEVLLKRAEELVAEEKFSEACVEFEAVLAQLPEHRAAKARLETTRSAAETKRRRDLTAGFVSDARKAFEAKDCERCLELLQKASDVPAPDQAEAEIATLRNDARALQAAMEASRRARSQAEKGREGMLEARTAAASQGTEKYAAAEWKSADETVALAESQFEAEKYSEAFLSFEAAIVAFQKAVDEAREARERERREAEAAEAARRLKVTNEILAEARTAFADRAYARCQDILRRAIDVPPPEQSTEEIRKLNEAAETALQNERRAKTPAQTSRMLMTETRSDAQGEGAETRAAEAWKAGETKSAEGAAAFNSELFISANEAFEAAIVAFRTAREDARASKQREAEAAEAARQVVVAEERRQLATRFLAEAQSAHDRGDQELCLDVLDAATRVSSTPEALDKIATLRRAAETARMQRKASDQARLAEEQERRQAESAREAVVEAVRGLHGQSSATSAAGALWEEVEATIAAAHAAFARGNFPAASAAYDAALVLCRRCADEIREAAAKEREAAAKAAETPAPPAPASPSAPPPPPATPAPAKGRLPSQQAAAPADPELAKSLDAAFAGKAAAKAASAGRNEPAAPWSPAQPERPAGFRAPPRNGAAGEDAAERRTFTPAVVATIVVLAAVLAVALIRFEYSIARPQAPPGTQLSSAEGAPAAEGLGGAIVSGEAGGLAASPPHPETSPPPPPAPAAPSAASASPDAKAAGDAKAAEAPRPSEPVDVAPPREVDPVAEAQAAREAQIQSAREAKAAAEARIVATAKAVALASTSATANAAKEGKAAQARAAADAKAAKAMAEADARAAAVAKAERAPAADASGKPLFVKAYASVFNEPTDGKRVGGAWGACWRADPAAARACAKASCEATRRSGQPCSESASTQPGGHCAVALASGYGVSAGACSATRAEAEAAASAGCARALARNYKGSDARCSVAWSTDPR